MTKIDSKIPEGPVAEKWTNYKAHQKLVNPANKRRLDIIVVQKEDTEHIDPYGYDVTINH